MIGGRIIENIQVAGQRRLWCVDRNGDECAVFAEENAAQLKGGEEIWWQDGTIYARRDKLKFNKLGFSFNPGARALSGNRSEK